MKCQWCRGPMTEVPGVTPFCQRGCHERPIFATVCIDCRKEFSTGNIRADQCKPCEEAEDARYRAQEAGEEISRGYTADMIANGASRRAHAMGKR